MFIQYIACTYTSPSLSFVCFHKGICDCLRDLETNSPYTGKVSTTNNGFTCQSWSSQTPHAHMMTKEDFFTTDRSLRRAKNFCRELEGEAGRPWCYTTHPHVRWDYCTFSICTGKITTGQRRYAVANNSLFIKKKVQEGKDQEKAQLERDSHSKNRGGKKPN